MKGTVASGIGCTIYLGFWAACSLLMSLWTQRNVDFWFSRFAGHPVHCPLWLAWIATFVLNGIALAFDVIGELARLIGC